MSSFYQRYLRVVEATDGNKYVRQQAFVELMQLELEIVLTELKGSRCTPITQIRIPEAIHTLQRWIDEQIQNPVLFTWLFCSIETGLVTPRFQTIQDVDRLGRPINRDIISGYDTNIPATRMVISSIEHLSTSGAFGDIWRTLVLGSKSIALLKTSKKTLEDDFIVHEFFIGYCLNKLRGEVPNFMYVYGMFRCQNPDTGLHNRQVCPPVPYNKDWDEYGTDDRDHLIMEYIRPGFPLGSIVGRMNFIRFMGLYLQAVAACAVAYHRIKFTHYDLHDGNVLIQETFDLKEYYIPYTFEGITIYIKTQLIVKIIDYGHSHVSGAETVDGISTGRQLNFGNINQSDMYYRQAFAPNVFYDIYMLAGRLLDVLKFGKTLSPMDPVRNSAPNLELFKQVHHIITFFPPFNKKNQDVESIEFNKALTKERANEFTYRPVEQDPLVTATPFSSYLAHLVRNYPQLVGDVICYGRHCIPRDARILDCNNLQCSNWNDIENMVRTPK